MSEETNEEERARRREEELRKYRGTPFDPELHDMGGDIGPASMGGTSARPAGRDEDEEPRRGPEVPRETGSVNADLEWKSSDHEDPNGGLGGTDADDGGYLPGEGTGRPPG
ncbi:hypothetical protein ACQP10_14130 [Streptosporangium sandarakinum]|uniref:hypothetical protein n=1 Tax=Streptosporangium sandarakinum TaxID=1260955 RepID=UPI003D8B9C9B